MARIVSALVVVVIAALQGLLNNLLRDILEIKVGFKGNTTSRIAAAVGLSRVAVRPLPDRSPQVLATADSVALCVQDHANKKHMGGFAELCKGAGILRTPVTCFLDADAFQNMSCSVSPSAKIGDNNVRRGFLH